MTDVKAGVEYKIDIDGKSFLLDEKKFNLLIYIRNARARKEIGLVNLLKDQIMNCVVIAYSYITLKREDVCIQAK